jgi:hypothetical protein
LGAGETKKREPIGSLLFPPLLFWSVNPVLFLDMLNRQVEVVGYFFNGIS